MRVWLAIVAGLVATPAMAADQFDLVCSGRWHERVNAKWKPAQYRYRVDLAASKWCEGSCDGTSQITNVTDLVITLTDKKRDRFNDLTESHWISRQTGDLHYTYLADGLFEEREGKCTVAAFSGFPEPKRLF